MAVSYIDDSLGKEKTDTISNGKHYQIYASDAYDWILHNGKCYRLVWSDESKDDSCRAAILSDTVLIFVVSDDPPCGKVEQKSVLVPEKFYTLDRKGRYKEWEPQKPFAGTQFKLYKNGEFYYIAYRGYCMQANQLDDNKKEFEVRFGGDTVGVFIRTEPGAKPEPTE